MWWRICKGLSILVLIAAALLTFLKIKQSHPAEDEQGITAVQIKTPVPYNETDSASAEPAAAQDSQPFASVLPVTVETVETDPQESADQTAFAGSIRCIDYPWESVYQSLSQYPNEKRSISENHSGLVVTNTSNETFYIYSGYTTYLFNDASNQLFELTSYPTQIYSMDKALIQEGKTALSAEIEGMSRKEVNERIAQIMDSLFQSDRYHVQAMRVYGYSGEQLKKVHRLLYEDRGSWGYYYKNLPSEAENGLYYIELQYTIDGIPVCTEAEALGLHYSVYSKDYIRSTGARLVLSKDRILYLEMDCEFDLSSIQSIDLLPEEEIQRIIRAGLKNNPQVHSSSDFQKCLLYLYVQHGIGDTATYELRPAWRVETGGKEDINVLTFYDAASGEQLF